AAIAVTIAHTKECEWRRPQSFLIVGYFGLVTLIFIFTLIDNVIARTDGILIATAFILALLISSAVSRWARSTEMRTSAVTFADEESAELWKAITGKKVNLIPHQRATTVGRNVIEEKLRKHFVLKGPLAFMHVHLQDNRSEFLSTL